MSRVKWSFLPEVQKRMKLALTAMCVNYLLFVYGMTLGTDLVALGTGLTMVNVPLMAYILGETFRPSIKNTTSDEGNCN